ncbi:hypothetical protein ACIPEN_14400, partial [Herbaspirillum chlorophenolicum]
NKSWGAGFSDGRDVGRLEGPTAAEVRREALEEESPNAEMNKAVSTLRWILNKSSEQCGTRADTLFDKTHATDCTTNRQHLEWLWSYLQSSAAQQEGGEA